MLKKLLTITLLLLLSIQLMACSNPEKKMLEASQLVASQQYDEAITIYSGIIKKNPEHTQVYIALSQVYEAMDEKRYAEQALLEGIAAVKDQNPLKIALAQFYNREGRYEEAAEVFLAVLESGTEGITAYEGLLELYRLQHQHEEVLALYNLYGDRLTSQRATIAAALSALNLHDFHLANQLMAEVEVEEIEEIGILEGLVNFYIQAGDENKAILLSEKALSIDPEAYVFHGFLYELNNQDGFVVLNRTAADVTGDGRRENILVMGENHWGDLQEMVQVVIQDTVKGEVIDLIEIDEIGYPSNLEAADLDHDGAADILVSIHSGGTAGIQSHYVFSYKNGRRVELLQDLQYTADFEFVDNFYVEAFSKEAQKLFRVELSPDQKESYRQSSYYASSGKLLDWGIGYFRGDELRIVYIEELQKYGLRNYTWMIGPDHNSDYIGEIETLYLYEGGKWRTYDLKVTSEGQGVEEVAYRKDWPKSDARKLAEKIEIIGATKEAVQKKYGTPRDQGWYGWEYYRYDDMLVFFASGNRVSGIWLMEGQEILGIKLEASFQEIKKVLGEPIEEGYDDMEGEYYYHYYLGDGMRVYFAATTKNGKAYAKVYRR